MAQAPSPATNRTDLPTIIIDPVLYEPERPSQSKTLYDNFIRLTRVTLAATAVGGATFGVASVLDVDSLLSSGPVSALTSAVSGYADSAAEDRAAPELAASLPAQPAQGLLAPEAARFDVLSAREPARFDALVAEAPEAAPASAAQPRELSVAEASAAEPIAAEPSATAATPALPRAVSHASATMPSATAKAANKTAKVQEDLRNARRLLGMNQLEQAEAAYRGVLALNDGEPAALTGLARVQLARGQLDEALASAKRAVEKAPGAQSAHLALGDVLRARGDMTAAQAHYDQTAQPKAAEDTSEP